MDSEPLACSNDADRRSAMLSYVEKRFAGRPYGIVWVKDNALPRNDALNLPKTVVLTRVLVVLEGRPVALDALKNWRKWAVNVGARDVQVQFVPAGADVRHVEETLNRWCGNWAEPLVTQEPVGLEVGTYITMGEKEKDKDDPDLLTMMFGSMGDLLTRIDLLRKRFEGALYRTHDRKKYLKDIDDLLGEKEKNVSGTKAPVYAASQLRDRIPRLLLRGETGVGKTLIARYLQNDATRRPPRILIPEYLHKEDMFEYALFGYARGSYTGGHDLGAHGLLLENVGGVVFLDEIGDANDIIQAKLLGYLDDYMIRPRGWEGDPFYCPTLIVAATNQNLDELVKERKFRKDLLARFTDPETVPPLRDRIESLPFILDCLLQSDAINSGGVVRQIGAEAIEALKKHPFPENFRELEDFLRVACGIAAMEGRHYICRSDLRRSKASPHPAL